MILRLVRLLLLVLIAAGVGIAFARYRGLPFKPDPARIDTGNTRANPPSQEAWVKATAIDLASFRQHFESGSLVIDARSPEEFEKGHLNAALVINVPGDADDVNVVVNRRLLGCTGQPIVLYCSSGTCDASQNLWNVLQGFGFGPEVRIYHPGWEQMEKDGLPVATGPDTHGDSLCGAGAGEEPPPPPGDSQEPSPEPSGGG